MSRAGGSDLALFRECADPQAKDCERSKFLVLSQMNTAEERSKAIAEVGDDRDDVSKYICFRQEHVAVKGITRDVVKTVLNTTSCPFFLPLKVRAS